MSEQKWIPVNEVLPENGKVVMTKIDDEKGERNIQTLRRYNRLWFCTDNTYVYYEPTHWMPLRPNGSPGQMALAE